MATAEESSSYSSDHEGVFVTESNKICTCAADVQTSAAFSGAGASTIHYYVLFLKMLLRCSYPIRAVDKFYKSTIEDFFYKLDGKPPTTHDIEYFERSILPPIDIKGDKERFTGFYTCVRPRCDIYLIYQPMPQNNTWRVSCIPVVDYIDIKRFLDAGEHFVQSIEVSEDYSIRVHTSFYTCGWKFYQSFSRLTILKKDIIKFAADPRQSNMPKYHIGSLAYKGAGSADISTVLSRFNFFDY